MKLSECIQLLYQTAGLQVPELKPIKQLKLFAWNHELSDDSLELVMDLLTANRVVGVLPKPLQLLEKFVIECRKNPSQFVRAEQIQQFVLSINTNGPGAGPGTPMHGAGLFSALEKKETKAVLPASPPRHYLTLKQMLYIIQTFGADILNNLERINSLVESKAEMDPCLALEYLPTQFKIWMALVIDPAELQQLKLSEVTLAFILTLRETPDPNTTWLNDFYIGHLTMDALRSLKVLEKPDDAKSPTIEKPESLAAYEMTLDEFKLALSSTRWGDTLTPYAKNLFYIATETGKYPRLPIRDYFKIIAWLGDPELNAKKAIPVDVAINFYYELTTKNVTALKIFRCITKTELEKLSNVDKSRLGPILRLNEGRVVFDPVCKEIFFFHRNLVFTEYVKDTFAHNLLYTFDNLTYQLKEDDLRDRKVRRAVNKRETIDSRTLRSLFNAGYNSGLSKTIFKNLLSHLNSQKAEMRKFLDDLQAKAQLAAFFMGSKDKASPTHFFFHDPSKAPRDLGMLIGEWLGLSPRANFDVPAAEVRVYEPTMQSI